MDIPGIVNGYYLGQVSNLRSPNPTCAVFRLRQDTGLQHKSVGSYGIRSAIGETLTLSLPYSATELICPLPKYYTLIYLETLV